MDSANHALYTAALAANDVKKARSIIEKFNRPDVTVNAAGGAPQQRINLTQGALSNSAKNMIQARKRVADAQLQKGSRDPGEIECKAMIMQHRLRRGLGFLKTFCVSMLVLYGLLRVLIFAG